MTEELNLEDFIGLTGEEVWEKLYGKELNTKKSVLEYIEKLKVLKKGEVDYDQMQSIYNFVFFKIDDMRVSIKPNTIMFLKNELKKQIGKFVFEKEPYEQNYFIEFFKEAYPNHERRKDFTWVLMDINTIADEQIWTTLTYINHCCTKGLNLREEEKKDIITEIERLVSRKNIKYINNVRSLEALNKQLKIKIVTKKDNYMVKVL